MYFNIADFNTFIVNHLLKGYAPAQVLLRDITIRGRNNVYFVGHRKFEEMYNMTPRQRREAASRLEEAGIIKVLPRFRDDNGQTTNQIVRLPIQQEHMDAYVQNCMDAGVSVIKFRTSNGYLVDMIGDYLFENIKEYEQGYIGKAPRQSIPLPFSAEGKICDRTGLRKSNAFNSNKNKQADLQDSSPAAPPLEERNHYYEDAAASLSSSPAAPSTSSVLTSFENDSNEENRSSKGSKTKKQTSNALDMLLKLVDRYNPNAKKPTSNKKRNLLLSIIYRMGVKNAAEYMEYVLKRGHEFMANFGWDTPDIYALYCRGARDYWKLETGRVTLATISSHPKPKQIQHMKLINSDEWNESKESTESSVGW